MFYCAVTLMPELALRMISYIKIVIIFFPCLNDIILTNRFLKHTIKIKKLDSKRKDLIYLCISNQLRIVNGRVLGDTFGNFTCYTIHGASTVDYVRGVGGHPRPNIIS